MKSIRNIKPLWIVLFLVLVSFCLFNSFFSSAQENEKEKLTVGVPVDRCPIIYKDVDTGKIVGIGVDLMRTAADNAGYEAEFIEIKEATLKDALDDPEYDVVMPFGSPIPSTSGRTTIVSDNLMTTTFTLLTRGNKTIPPLNELRVGMLKSQGGVADTVRQLYPGITIQLYEDMDSSVKALRKGKVDALLHNTYVWSYVLEKPSYSDLVVQPAAMFSMDFRVGVADTPAGRELISRLNQGINTISDSYRQAIVLDYTTRRLYRWDLSDYIYQYRHVALMSTLLITALIVIFIFRNRALKLEQEEKVRWLIDHDPLTGALSLDGFRKKAESLIRKHPDIPYLLSYVNIKNFKFINDSFGMKAGDELLQFWLKKTQETLSEEEAVCRIESDHVAVLRYAGGDEKVSWDDKNVIDSVRDYFASRGKEHRVQICGGLYFLTPEDYHVIDVDHMLDYARVAEEKVRETRKDGYEFYNPEQWERGKKVAEVVGRLPNAIKTGEIQVWYQPQVDYKTGEINGMEALCRWNHAKLGWIPPSDFIPELEESGLIYELDSYVWEKVCQDLKRWNDQGIHRSVSVNVSRSDISTDRDIPGQFKQLIEKYGLSTDQLRVEITETAFAEHPEFLIETTVKLRELGIQIEMDDFGSGYSSLHMLKEVYVDRIKLDYNFLTGKGDIEKGKTIVGYMIQMVKDIGMEMIVEGVETKEQADFLLNKGCSEMQGYYFYKPMSVKVFESLK